ncbi:hypothetical protein MKK84_05585 [Methylobacterium sp. E-065]|uniref:hypothetical protein n=1 Tax=Methylobacterium sp. E-065 TaxID=2836583 RepID=UPI001FB8B5FC|nr:hypothetical protein [Methylobacterium sp. E-065]MCJ2016901.1 hypothetical protein [Methylobacterium sp. E-065]
MAERVESQPSSKAEEAVRSVLSALAAQGAFRTPKLRRADMREFKLVSPHRVFLIPLAILKGDQKAELTDVGWRFIIEVNGEGIASAEAISRPNGQFQFSGLNEGPLVDNLVDTLKGVDILGQGFQPRLVLAPGVNTAALWLKKAGGSEFCLAETDVVVQLVPIHHDRSLRTLTPVPEFISSLKSLASALQQGGAKGG